MAKNPKQKQKLLYICKLLYEKTDEDHGVTVKEIIDYLERYSITAERKSIYDDIRTLEDFGVDICRQKTDSVRYFIGSREFELPQLKLLVDAIVSSKFITIKKTNELIKKIESLSSTYDARKLQRQVYVSNRVKTMNETIYYSVDRLHEAIENGSMISFYYTQWAVSKGGAQKIVKCRRHDGARYTVSPWALCWDDENYYLIAYDKQSEKIKHYRVDKIEEVEVLKNTTRDGRELFSKLDMAVYSKQVFGMYGGETKDIKIKVDNSLVGVIVDRFGKDIFISLDSEDCFVASVSVMLSPQFFGWLFALGDKAKLVYPKSAVEQYKEYLENCADLYR